jgi:hypothetical protein
MDTVVPDSTLEDDSTDRSAILMMLTYVEVECRRLGELDAAQHAALAASLLSPPEASAGGSRSTLPANAMPLNPVH